MASCIILNGMVQSYPEGIRALGGLLNVEDTDIFAAVNDPFTICTIYFKADEATRAGCGFAKRNPKDKWDERFGVRLAFGRAVKDPVEHMGRRKRAIELLTRKKEASYTIMGIPYDSDRFPMNITYHAILEET